MMARMPLQVGQAMTDFTKIREYVAGLGRGKDKQRAVATLNLQFSAKQLAEMLGIKESFVRYANGKNRDIGETASIARNNMIGDMSEHRVIELLQKMDVDKIDDHRKPQAVKYLMDSVAIAKEHQRPVTEKAGETVTELIYRVRQRMNPKEEQAIDITAEVRDRGNSEKVDGAESSERGGRLLDNPPVGAV